MTNRPSSSTQVLTPLEPYEPWRVGPRHRGPRRRRSRRWLVSLLVGLLASSATALVLKLGESPSGKMSSAAIPDAKTGVIERPSVMPSRVAATPTPDRPRHHEARRDHHGHRRTYVPTHPAMPQTSATDSRYASRSETEARRAEHEARRDSRARPSRQRPLPRRHVRSHKTPAWVRPECRRRFPHDSTRQAACVAALRSYFSR